MLFDTDVLIWYFRGNPKAATAIDREDVRRLSVASYMELLQGARNKEEQKQIRLTLGTLGFQTIAISENISHRAAIYMEEHSLKVALCPMDALIAATAIESNLPLMTGNRKHFRVIKDLDLKTFRP